MAGGEQVVQIGGRRLRITNLDKVLYPETGTTKGEIIDYYTRIAPFLIPHVADRPVTRKRWPDGVGTAEHPGESFFAKDLERGAPEWVRRLPIVHSTGTKDYPLVDDLPTLVYLAQVASLELHVPQWRFAPDGERMPPDRLVLDLDPGTGVGLPECAEVARTARTILEGMGLTTYPVTSGSKGLHLYAALTGTQTSDQVSAVAKELARAMEADRPDLVVSAMSKAQRPGRVFVDWSQNNGAKTTVAPYSLRGRAQPWVAAPRTWDELDDPDLRQLLFTEVLERAERMGDPMAALGFRAGAHAPGTGPLSAYIAKRTAGKTPEPVPDNPLAAPTPPGERPRFVIQEHHATRLHWDLRLEHDGVFVSWAVPKGVPATSGRNNLAVMTEDHPLEYGSFEGTIPRGEYGAGDVTIWDDGRYELEKWRDDEVIATLDGRPGGPMGRVRIALIRTSGAGEKSSWLLHRMKTDAGGHAQPPGEPAPAVSEPTPPRPVEPVTAPERRPMLAAAASADEARRTAARWDAGEVWAELKWDGVRAIGVWDGRRLRLYARSGTDITARYPELTGVDAGLGADPAVIDGEIVALDGRGRPSFHRLQNRMHLSKPREIEAERARTPVRYYLYDLLSHRGEDTAARPLRERRALLEEIAADPIEPIAVPPVFADVDDALAASEQYGLEGVVVKNPGARYRRGVRSEDWLKVKPGRTQEVVIGGIRRGESGRQGIRSLLMGIPGADGLQYVGRVGSGFSDAELARIARALDPVRTDACPFLHVPAAEARDALWVRPEHVGEVVYADRSDDGILRHARWRGLRPDKSPAEVVPEP